MATPVETDTATPTETEAATPQVPSEHSTIADSEDPGKLAAKKKGVLKKRRGDDLKFKKYALLSLRKKLQAKTRMTTQFADIFQDLGTDFFQQICQESARLAKGGRVSLKEVTAATNLVLGRSKLAERCIQAGVEAIKYSGVLKEHKALKGKSSVDDKEKATADMMDDHTPTSGNKSPTPNDKDTPVEMM
jgi:hypothetical protein